MKLTRKTSYALNAALLMAVLVLSLGVTTAVIYRSQKKAAYQKLTDLTARVGGDLDGTLSRIESAGKTMFLTERFQDLASALAAGEDALNEIDSHFATVISFDPALIKNAVYVPRVSGRLDFDSTVSYGYGYEYIGPNVRRIAAEAEKEAYAAGKSFITPLYYFDGSATPYYAVARNVIDIRDTTYFQPLGLGVVFVSVTSFSSALSYSGALDGLRFTLLGPSDEVIASDGGERAQGRTVSRLFLLGRFGWSVRGDFDTRQIWTSLKNNFVFLLATLVISFAFFLCVTYFLHKKSSASLDYLFGVFSDFGQSRLTAPVAHTGDDEVNRVIDSFNAMTESLKTMGDEVLRAKNRELRLELEKTGYALTSLYAQINKHFLINALSLIRSLVSLGETAKTKRCIEALSGFLRYSLTMKDRATADEEMKSLESYFAIQALWYPGVTTETSCEAAAANVPVPKMILQPIAENAFMHGLKDKRGHIRAVARVRGGYVCFFISDDGEGMPPGAAAALTKALREGKTVPSATGNGLALANVQQRLRLIAGPRSYLRVKSVAGRGTTVAVKIYIGGGHV